MENKLNYADYKVIGQRIQKARKTKKLTQDKVSEFLQFSSSYLSNLENGKAKINLERLYQICYLLECDVDMILTGTNRYREDYLAPELNSILRDKSPEQINYAMDIVNTLFKK